MNTKTLALLFMLFGLLATLAQCGRLSERGLGDDSSSSSSNEDEEKRAVLDFLQNEEDASQFLDQSRRLFSGTKDHMKEAKKKYEEKCERTFHPRYCPDLAQWPAWNDAWSKATK